MKRIAIINFTGFRGNWGCQATSIELVKFISGCFAKDTPLQFHFVPLLPSSKVDQDYDKQLDQVFASFSNVANQSERAESSLKFLEMACVERYGFWADIVRQADVVVFQAEGTMGMGANFARGPRLMLLPFVAKHAWGRTVISLNQSFYSHNEKIRQNAAEAFGSFDFTAFREGASFALARHCGVANAAYVPDVAFMSPKSCAPWTDMIEGGDYFAVSGSALKDPNRYQLIMDQAEQISQATGLKPLLALSRDYKMTLRARLKWPRSFYAQVPSGATYTQVAGLFARCRFLLSGRYHMSILSAAAGTPNIILTGNSFKNEGLVSLLGMKRPVHGFSDTDQIVDEAIAVHNSIVQERRALDAQMDVILTTINNAQKHIASIIAGGPVQTFEDILPKYKLDMAILDRYYSHGRGKGDKPSRALPGKRQGKELPMRSIIDPLLHGLKSDPNTTLHTLQQMALADKKFKAALKNNLSKYPALNQLPL